MKVLIIGYGSIGRRHFEILSKQKKISKILICSISNSVGKNNLNYDKASIINYNPDYIIISSETSLHKVHLNFINKILKNKIILVEKPIYHSTKIKKISNIQNKIFVGYNLRFDPMINYTKKLFNNKNMKKSLLSVTAYCGSYLPNWRSKTEYIYSYSSDYKKGGGVEYDLSHEFDYIDWIFGEFKKTKKVKNKISSLNINSNDHLIYIGKFSNHKFLNITLNYFSRINFRFFIVETDVLSMKVDLVNRVIYKKTNKSNTLFKKYFKYDRNYSYKKMHESIINNKFKDLCTYGNAIKILNYL